MKTSFALILFVLLIVGSLSCQIRSTSTPLDVSQRAPDFSLINQEGQEVTLASLTAQGPAVLVFNRGHR